MNAWIIFGLVAAASAALDYKTLPGFNYDKWWGSGEQVEDTRILPYKIEFKQEMIDDLVDRLKNRRDFVPSMDGVAYNYGVNTHTIGYWLDYWANNYNFTEREAYMNEPPHYTTNIRGLNIHFIWHVPEVPEGKKKIPVLMLHGFPGSVREFYEAAPHIIANDDDRDFVVELVTPSLVGFAYSDYTNKTGLGAPEMGYIFKLLMERLGHDQFVVQGGDLGAHIGDFMATAFPDNVIGFHTNMGFVMTNNAVSLVSMGSLYPEALVPENLISRLYPLEDTLKFVAREFGYFHMQATKPDTVGICLTDSPSGLLAWIFQLVSMASRRANINDTRGGLDMYSPVELLDNAMTYWATNKAASAIRIYAETANLRNHHMGYMNEPTDVPTVIVQAKNELYYFPPAALNDKYHTLLDVVVLDDYGHFLALEQPKLFAELFLDGLSKILEYNEKKSSKCSLANRK